MQALHPTEHKSFDAKKTFAGLDISLFFRKELRKLVEQYGYSEEDYEAFLSWHQPKELVEKILDPDRFFRIIRDTDGKIVGFFESRNRWELETVQWIFIEESVQGQGLGKKLWDEFFIYCSAREVKQVRSFVKESNVLSCWLHEKLWFQKVSTDEDGCISFEKKL